jgi:hypothetical protein
MKELSVDKCNHMSFVLFLYTNTYIYPDIPQILLKNLGTYPRNRCLGRYLSIIPLGYVSGYPMPNTGKHGSARISSVSVSVWIWIMLGTDRIS